jgi:hypothetical protein
MLLLPILDDEAMAWKVAVHGQRPPLAIFPWVSQ